MSTGPGLFSKCRFIAGPTAVGKTAASLLIAQSIDAEIVSMDSMAVYRHMDIGTAKPNAEERSVVPHHLIDLVDPSSEFSVSEYVNIVNTVVQDIQSRGRIALFVGGTGLYLRSLLRGVFDGPEADEELREKLEAQRLTKGNAWLLQQLHEVDPVSARRLHPNDVRRIIRAIEVHSVTGTPLSSQQNHPPLPESERSPVVLWIEPPRVWLHDRINRRVDQMMQRGLLEEVGQLLQRVPAPGKTARQGLGYRELIDHLENKRSLRSAVEQIKIGTRQFAKRQCTWFRGLEECQSLTIDGTETPAQMASLISAAAD